MAEFGRRGGSEDEMIQKFNIFHCSVTYCFHSHKDNEYKLWTFRFLQSEIRLKLTNSSKFKLFMYFYSVSWLSKPKKLKSIILKFSTILQTVPQCLFWNHRYSKVMLELLACLFIKSSDFITLSHRFILRAGTRQSVHWQATGQMAMVRFAAGIKDFFSTPQCPDQVWGPPAFSPMSTGGSSPRGKMAGAWSWLLTSI
jgi:hypothetical protein